MKTNKSPWKSGYGAVLSLYAFVGMVDSIVFLAFSLLNPDDQIAIILLIIGLFLFGVCTTFGVANWLIEKQVNQNLVDLEYSKPFETNFNLIDDVEDPIVSLSHKGQYVSRHNDKTYTVDLIFVVLGLSLYIFKNPNDVKSNFCVVYNRYGLAPFKLTAYERAK